MANHRLIHWQRFAPNLGDNLELLTDQLTIEVAVGLSKTELAAFDRAIGASHAGPELVEVERLHAEWKTNPATNDAAATAFLAQLEAANAKQAEAYAAKLAEAWADFVRIGPGNHSINGQPLTCLRDYLGFVCGQAGQFNFIELQAEVARANSVKETRALFSPAPSGGRSSTQPQNGAKAGSPTAGR